MVAMSGHERFISKTGIYSGNLCQTAAMWTGCATLSKVCMWRSVFLENGLSLVEEGEIWKKADVLSPVQVIVQIPKALPMKTGMRIVNKGGVAQIMGMRTGDMKSEVADMMRNEALDGLILIEIDMIGATMIIGDMMKELVMRVVIDIMKIGIMKIATMKAWTGVLRSGLQMRDGILKVIEIMVAAALLPFIL